MSTRARVMRDGFLGLFSWFCVMIVLWVQHIPISFFSLVTAASFLRLSTATVGLSRRAHHGANTPLRGVLKLEELTGMATKLYVGNLSPNTTENQILELFKQSGNVTSCQLIVDKVTNKSKGFAFVEMGSEAEAAKALSDHGGKELDGRALKVNEAKPREERPITPVR